jgi:hypothetical protein
VVFDWAMILKWVGIDQPLFFALFIGALPSAETGSANAKVAAGLRHLSYPFSIVQHPQFALDLALVLLRHFKKVSHQQRHAYNFETRNYDAVGRSHLSNALSKMGIEPWPKVKYV